MTQLSEDTKNDFMNTLKNFLPIEEDEIKNFCEILKKNNAVIAGGSVAKSVYKKNWLITDLDIYVNIKNAIPVRDFICKFSEFVKSKGADNLYCNSFLHKNRIYKVMRFIINDYKHIDLMYVYNNRSIIDCVNNFDLTCCQSWFDGENVFTSHPELVVEGRCHLNSDYIKSLLSGNLFTQNRVRKYTSRGIKVITPSYEILNLNNRKEDYKMDISQSLKLFVFNAVFKNTGVFRNTVFDTYFEDDMPEPQNYLHIPELIDEEYVYFAEDGYDYEEFNSKEDYYKINKKTQLHKILNKLQDILENPENYYYNEEDEDEEEPLPLHFVSLETIISYRKELYKIFGLKPKEDASPENKYENFTEKCHDDIRMTEEVAGEFLSQSNDNIIIKSGEKLLSFKRSEVIRFLTQKRKIVDKIEITETYLHHTILYSELDKIKNPNINLFILKDNGIKIKDKVLYILEPISVEKYIKISESKN